MGRFASVAFNRYPGAEDYLSLTRQIAANFKVQPENILLGNGSSEIIEKLFYCFGGSKDAAIVYPQPSFSMYGIYAAAAEAKGVPVDLEPDYTLDLEKFVSAVIKNKARLCVICNPNNPTGTGFSVSDIQYIADNIPTSCAFLVDEAYVEFYGQSAVSLLKDYPNIKVVDSQTASWSQSDAMTLAENWIVNYPDLKGIYSANDTMALGAVEALKNAGKNGTVKVSGCDGIEAALNAVKDGDMVITNANDGYCIAGYGASYAIQAALGILDPTTIPDNERLIFCKTTLVTADNADDIINKFIKTGDPGYDYSDLSYCISAYQEDTTSDVESAAS